MTANRHNIDEALDAYRFLSSVGIDSFRTKRPCGCCPRQ
ncbi:hypothetical protein FBZ94_11922 [Bradyrhizobium sacchari]|uniref:Uncharacterized protein n=1 Tax=Bradyrhizobium sacchari TaxID=1399419 RepID=A0A560HM46_9BRAD|nr:hypothetical protein FBZ94_11922 [Bradyrhizobium sacchari]TWB66147.1 hypothetical protein FBZ95_11822 [Bradyrhizobium sacchari]